MNHDLEPADTFPVDRTAERGLGRRLRRAADARRHGERRQAAGGPGRPAASCGTIFEAGKPVGAICHAPWTLIDAEVARGRTLTSYPSIWTDLRNAGATVVDEEVVTDHGLVSSRQPGRPAGVLRQDRRGVRGGCASGRLIRTFSAPDPGTLRSMEGPDAAAADATPTDDRPEGPLERADRNMSELLQELRVAQTGRADPVRVPAHAVLPAALRDDRRVPALDLRDHAAAVGGHRRAAGRPGRRAPGDLPARSEDRDRAAGAPAVHRRAGHAGAHPGRRPCCWCWTWRSGAGSPSRWRWWSAILLLGLWFLLPLPLLRHARGASPTTARARRRATATPTAHDRPLDVAIRRDRRPALVRS